MKVTNPPINVGSHMQKVAMKLGHEVSVFSSGHEAYSNYSTTAELPSFESLAESFFSLAETRLSETQKFVLWMSARLLKYHKLTVTALADLLSRRSTVPYSTVKWNLRTLMELGFLMGGDSESRGTPASLTASASMLAEYLDRTNNWE
ncbi:MAG: hypothetical protein RTU30_06235 [Candidatus Thorarchaeota archaeon]